ncbi:MAG: hypothetical protein J3K34DRAFT_518607 [Monoraphidium minutum]|nr:MAG: hypothetical protein J3K34DRAFT_518607 [Monoraphidium minutum]
MDPEYSAAHSAMRHPAKVLKGAWRAEEDAALKTLVEHHGEGNWSAIARELNRVVPGHQVGRVGKQCRERWNHHLRPNINKAAWSLEEEAALIAAHRRYGNRWCEIAKAMPTRTENSLKNFYNSVLRRKDMTRSNNRNDEGVGLALRAYMEEQGLLLPYAPHPRHGYAAAPAGAPAPWPLAAAGGAFGGLPQFGLPIGGAAGQRLQAWQEGAGAGGGQQDEEGSGDGAAGSPTGAGEDGGLYGADTQQYISAGGSGGGWEASPLGHPMAGGAAGAGADAGAGAAAPLPFFVPFLPVMAAPPAVPAPAATPNGGAAAKHTRTDGATGAVNPAGGDPLRFGLPGATGQPEAASPAPSGDAVSTPLAPRRASPPGVLQSDGGSGPAGAPLASGAQAAAAAAARFPQPAVGGGHAAAAAAAADAASPGLTISGLAALLAQAAAAPGAAGGLAPHLGGAPVQAALLQLHLQLQAQAQAQAQARQARQLQLLQQWDLVHRQQQAQALQRAQAQAQALTHAQADAEARARAHAQQFAARAAAAAQRPKKRRRRSASGDEADEEEGGGGGELLSSDALVAETIMMLRGGAAR